MLRAVIVGINAYPDAPLAGCLNDAEDVASYLVSRGVARRDITELRDAQATQAAIAQSLRDVAAASAPGDRILFHYSGHGTQVASQDPGEPDGLDEALCPYDFDFERPSTWLTDNDLAALFALVPAGVAMTSCIDACHSGTIARIPLLRDELSRAAKRTVRFLPPPAALRPALALRHPRRRSARGNDRVAVVSACASTESAADTSFDGRPNGAFTYYFLRALEAQATPLAGLVDAVGPSLEAYLMHPELDAPAWMQRDAFLAAPPAELAPATGAPSAEIAGAPVVYRGRWEAAALGARLQLSLTVASAPRGLELRFETAEGEGLAWTFLVSSDARKVLSLGHGITLRVAVTRWRATAERVSFELAVDVVAPQPLPATALVRERLNVARTAPPRARLSSSAELPALLELARAVGASTTPLRAEAPSRPRATGERVNLGECGQIHFGGGLFGQSYNANMDYELPNGYVRDEVEVVLDPPGSGNVHFVRWNSPADPTRASFEYHVGVQAFWGGRARFYMIARPVVIINNPEIRGPAAAAPKPSDANGSASAPRSPHADARGETA